MKSIKFLLVIAALLFLTIIGFSQSNKSNSKAIEKTDKIDNTLKSENSALALSESQKEQIVALHIERMNEVSAFRKNNSNKEEVKAKSKELNKTMNTKIRGAIFTEEQAKVHKASRGKRKGKNGKVLNKLNKASKESTRKKTKNPAKGMTVAEADKIYAAATAKQKAKAEKATEKLNVKMIASDASLALSVHQRKQINALNLKDLLERAKMEKAGASKDQLKEVLKRNKRAIRSILTKEQKDIKMKKK